MSMHVRFSNGMYELYELLQALDFWKAREGALFESRLMVD
jgi:hypothetical protein